MPVLDDLMGAGNDLDVVERPGCLIPHIRQVLIPERTQGRQHRTRRIAVENDLTKRTAAAQRGLAAIVHIQLVHLACPNGQVGRVVLMHIKALDISFARNSQAVVDALRHVPADINGGNVLSVQRQRQFFAAVQIGHNSAAAQHRHGAAVFRRLKRGVETGACVFTVRVIAVGIVHRLARVRARHLRRKHRAAPNARAVRAHTAVVAGKAAPVGADFHRADGEAMFVGQHRVVLPIRQHSGAVLVVAGQILLQITVIVHVVVAVHDGVRGRLAALIHQIDRIARIQQVGHHLLVRAAVIAQHLDLPDLHRALAGDLDAVCIRGDDLRVAAVLYRHTTAVCPQCTHAAGLSLGAVDDGQNVILINFRLRTAHPETVQIQCAAAGRAYIGHVLHLIICQHLDDGIIRPVRHRTQCFGDVRIHCTIVHLEIHHPRIAGRADAVVIPCRMGAGRAADAARLALPVDVVGGMLYDGHRRIVQVDALGPLGIARVYNSTVRLIKVLDGLSVRVAVGPALRQHLLQLSYQPRHA